MLYIALNLVGWTSSSTWIWGFDLSAFLPLPVAVAALLLAVLAAFPRVFGSRLSRADTRAETRTDTRMDTRTDTRTGLAQRGVDTRARVVLGILMAGLLVAGLAFPVRAHLLGNSSDILIRIANVFLGHAFRADLLYDTQPISTFVYLEAAKLAHSVFDAEVADVFRVIGALSGVLFVVGAWRLARALATDAWEVTTYLALLVGLPSLVFFFGYVEYYTLMYTLVIWYFALCARTFTGSRSIAIPGVVLTAAIGCHITAALLVPSYMLLVLHRSRPVWISVGRIAKGLGAVAVFSVAYYLLTDASTSHGFFIPLRADVRASYTLFSQVHILDILNLVAFYLAPALILAVALIAGVRPSIPRDDARPLFAVVAVFFPTLFLVSWNSLLGMARDWDVAAFWALAVVSSLAIFFSAIPKLAGRLRTFTIPMILLVLAANIPWIATNTIEGASIERSMALLRHYAPSISRQGTLTGYENIRKLAAQAPDPRFEIDILSEMLPHVLDPFDLTKLTTAIRRAEDPARYDHVMTAIGARLDTILAMYARPGGMSASDADAVERNFGRTVAEYGNYYLSQRRPAVAEDFSRRIMQRHPDLPFGFLAMAYLDMQSERSEAALQHSRLALRKGSEDVLLLCTKGFAEMLLGMGDSAFVTLSRAVEIAPDFGQANYEMGLYHLRFRNDTTTALRYLRKYVSIAGTGKSTQFARDIIQDIEDNRARR